MSYLTYQGKMLQSNHKYVSNVAAAPPIVPDIYATTTFQTTLKSTDNGLSFPVVPGVYPFATVNSVTLLNSNLAGIGNAGDIITGQQGYVFNVNQNTSTSPFIPVFVEHPAIHHAYTGYLWTSMSDSSIYLYDGGTTTWYKWGGNVPGITRFMDSSIVGGFAYHLYIGSAGVYNGTTFKQAGNFQSAMYLDSSTFYAGTTAGVIHKSLTWGDTWSVKYTGSGNIRIMLKADSGRILWAENDKMWYTDNDFSGGTSSSALNGNIVCGAFIGSGVAVIGTDTGYIYRTTNNGSNWSEIAGNPQQGEPGIIWLIKK